VERAEKTLSKTLSKNKLHKLIHKADVQEESQGIVEKWWKKYVKEAVEGQRAEAAQLAGCIDTALLDPFPLERV
jgi:hypothetical protein